MSSYKSIETDETSEFQKMQIIYPRFGLKHFKNKNITEDLVVEILGIPDTIKYENGYSNEFLYSKLGISIFFRQDYKDFENSEFASEERFDKFLMSCLDSNESPNIAIQNYQNQAFADYLASKRPPSDYFMEIHFRKPFQGMTEKGISLNKTYLKDAVMICRKGIYQKNDRLSWVGSDENEFIRVEFTGIAFHVRNDNLPFNEQRFLEKLIEEISCGPELGLPRYKA